MVSKAWRSADGYGGDEPLPSEPDNTKPCHLCGSRIGLWPSRHEHGCRIVHSEGRTGPLLTVACSTCGLVQTLPHPSGAEVRDYYQSGQYRREFPALPVFGLTAELEPTGHMVAPGEPDYETMLDRAGEHTARRLVASYRLELADRLLEVGCGDGRVAAALMALGHSVRAIEWDNAKAKARGVDVVNPDEADICTIGAGLMPADDASGRVHAVPVAHLHDFVYALQVAEHFSAPVGDLYENVVRYAKPGGVVVVEVPTVERPYVSLSHFFQRPHVVNYSTHTLAEALWAAGLDEARCRIEGSVLIGEGIRGPSGPRKRPPGYEWPGPKGEQVAAELQRWEHDRVHSRGAIVQRFMGGEDVGPDGLDVIREEFALWSQTTQRAVDGMGHLCKQLDDANGKREDWHPDPWVRGFLAGRLYEGQRMSLAVDRVNADVVMFLNRKAGE